MTLTGVPAEVVPWFAVPVALIGLWKLAGEGVKSWKDARQVGATPAATYAELAARVTDLERERREDAKARRDELERLVAVEEEMIRLRAAVRRLAGVLTREVAAVLAWITSGARPPAPDAEITLIRSVIADLERPSHKED